MVKQETYRPLPPDEIIRRIEKALKVGGGTHNWEDIRHGLLTGEFQMFWNEAGVLITQIRDHGEFRTLHCCVGAGRLEAVLALQSEMFRFGVSKNCKAVTMGGRRGWKRVLPKHGWKEADRSFHFDLQEAV